MNLAIIVLNYRTPRLALDCLASLEGQVGPQARVLVVDNASGDGSAEQIEQAIRDRGWSRWAEVMRSPVNGGFAAGNNFGIRAVDADAYLLLNSDTVVKPGAIEGLLAAMRARPDAGLIAPGLLDVEGRPDRSFFRYVSPWTELIRSARTGVVTSLLRRFDTGLPETDRPVEPDWVGFACVLIRREVIDQVGLLDEGYFMYFEDVDYCRRARAAGWTVLYWPEPKVVHLLGGSSNVTAEGSRHARAPRYYYEARARYYAKFYGRRGLWLANALWYVGRSISWSRELLGHTRPGLRAYEALDIWTNVLHPLREPGART